MVQWKENFILPSISRVPPELKVYLLGRSSRCSILPSFSHRICGGSPSGLEALQCSVTMLCSGSVWLAGPIWIMGGGRSATEVTYKLSHYHSSFAPSESAGPIIVTYVNCPCWIRLVLSVGNFDLCLGRKLWVQVMAASVSMSRVTRSKLRHSNYHAIFKIFNKFFEWFIV